MRGDLKVVNEVAGVVSQLAIENGFASPLQQQQLIKGLKDVNAGLVDGTHNGPSRVDNVTHSPHDNCSGSGVQTYVHQASVWLALQYHYHCTSTTPSALQARHLHFKHSI